MNEHISAEKRIWIKEYIILSVLFMAMLVVMYILRTLVNALAMIIFTIPALVAYEAYLVYLALRKDKDNLVPEPLESISDCHIRIRHLKKIAEKASMMGFKENSVYRLKTFMPGIVCQFKHKYEPIFLTADYGSYRVTFGFCTYFEPKGSLTTCSNSSPGNLPPLPSNQIRMFQTEDLEELLAEHKKGIEFFKQNSYKEKDLTLEEFTALFLSIDIETIKNVMKMKLWPFKAAWWMLIYRGRMYRKSIQEQVQSGMAKLE